MDSNSHPKLYFVKGQGLLPGHGSIKHEEFKYWVMQEFLVSRNEV